MDKQKQIEELIKIHCQDCGVCENCKFLGFAHDDFDIGRIDCIDYFFAESVYNAGYRKIPEGAVVLTGEEWRNLNKNYEILKLELKEARKETAEKFAEMAKEGAFTDFMGEPIIRASKIDEICKELIGGK